ncbi:hypothetical protein MKX01_020467, partial [Papaver californicum]
TVNVIYSVSSRSKYYSHPICLQSEELPSQAILQTLRDETMNDPRDRIEIAQSHAFYRHSLLGQP